MQTISRLLDLDSEAVVGCRLQCLATKIGQEVVHVGGSHWGSHGRATDAESATSCAPSVEMYHSRCDWHIDSIQRVIGGLLLYGGQGGGSPVP